MGMYKKKPTINEHLAVDPTLLNGLTLTFLSSPSLQSAVREMIRVELGDMETILEDTAALKAYLTTWSNSMQQDWTKWFEALRASYNPIHNYDRTEEETEGVETSSSVSGESSSENGGQDVRTVDRQGYNAADYVPADKDTTEYGGTGSTTSSTTGEGTTDRSRELHVSGNIGVTTSQMMVEAEVALRMRYPVARTMVTIFRQEICVGVW